MAYINVTFLSQGRISWNTEITANLTSRAPDEELELYNLPAGPKYRSVPEVK